MPKQTSLCGAETKTRATCRNVVERPGQRCYLHQNQPLDKQSMFQLCYKTIGLVAAIGGSLDFIEHVFETIIPHLQGWGGIIMPEHFWDAVRIRDRERMFTELKEAQEKIQRLEEKYVGYSDETKIDLEKVYLAILRDLESLEKNNQQKDS